MTGSGPRAVVLRNPSSASENRIHADEVAQAHGFRGGLVPGVTLYGYLSNLIVDARGEGWVERGGADVRFRAPCYEGEEAQMRLDGEGGVVLEVGGEAKVTGTVLESSGPPSTPRIESLPLPVQREPISHDGLVEGAALGSIEMDTGPAAVSAYEAKIGPIPDLLVSRSWVPPGMLLEEANNVLVANFVMPLWLHVGSTIRHHRPVAVGEGVEVRSRLERKWQQKGHRFLTAAVEWVAAGEVVASAAHTAIWALAPS